MAFGWPRYVPVTFSTAVNVSPDDLETVNRRQRGILALARSRLLIASSDFFSALSLSGCGQDTCNIGTSGDQDTMRLS